MKIEKPLQILLQRRAAIGDVIMTTGIVRELKRSHSHCEIDIATDVISVYKNNPHIRNIVPVDSVQINQYDKYINLDDAYETSPENNFVDTMFYRVFGDNTLNHSVELFPTEEDKQLVDADIAKWDSKFIVVHMRNWHWAAKNISMDIWLEVYTKLLTVRADFKVICVGGPTDFFIEDHPLFIDARAKYTDQQLKYVCDNAQAFVGIDSAPYWCAAASSTHIIALLTHLHPERILPERNRELGKNCTAIQTREECRGCGDKQARPIRYINCTKGNYPCAGNFDTEEITQAILKTL